MGRSVNRQGFAIVGILVVSVIAAAAIGAWESNASLKDTSAPESNFVLSGGTVADEPALDPGSALATQQASGPGRHASASRY